MEINSNRTTGSSVNTSTTRSNGFSTSHPSAGYITSHYRQPSIVRKTPIGMKNNSTATTSIQRPHAQFQRHPLTTISPNISQQELNHKQQILINQLLNEKYMAVRKKKSQSLRKETSNWKKLKKNRKEQERQRSISRRIVHNASTNQIEKIANAKKTTLYLDICRLVTTQVFSITLKTIKNKKIFPTIG